MTCVSHIKGSRCGGTVGGGDDGGYQRNDLICVLHCGGDDQRNDLSLQEIPLCATLCYIVVFCLLHGVETANQRNDLTLQEIVLCVCYYSVLQCVHCTLCKLSTDGKYQRNDLILNQIFCDKTALAAVDCADDDDDDTDDDDDDDTDDDDGLRTFEL